MHEPHVDAQRMVSQSGLVSNSFFNLTNIQKQLLMGGLFLELSPV